MTIEEALAIKTKNLTLTEGEIQLLALEAGLDGSAAYNPLTDGQKVDLAYAGLLLTIIHVTEVKEDDVSIKCSSDLRSIYSAIMRKWGLPDPFAIGAPTVRQVPFW